MGLFSKLKSVVNYLNQPVQPTYLHLMIGGVVIGLTAIATYQIPSLFSFFRAAPVPEPEPEPIRVAVETAGNYLWSLGIGTLTGLYAAYNRRWYNDKLNDISRLANSAHHKIANTWLGRKLPSWAQPAKKQSQEQEKLLKLLSEQLVKFNPEDPNKVSIAFHIDSNVLAQLCQQPFARGFDGQSKQLIEITLVQKPLDISLQLPMATIDSKKLKL